MDAEISAVKAAEILDSRGNPTIQTEIWLADGSLGAASVPSGASTGSLEALELRDLDSSRYFGKGVLEAVANVNSEICSHLLGRDATQQDKLDECLLELDGTPNKGRLGANAVLSVSLAAAKAAAASRGLPLYAHLADLFGNKNPDILPVPQMNILNGGAHADNQVDFQEFMVLPVGVDRFSEAVRMGAEIFHTLRGILNGKGLSTGIGDEGGFAPELDSNEEAVNLVIDAVEQAGFELETQVFLGLDVASSEFFDEGRYVLASDGSSYTTEEFIGLMSDWIGRFPIISVEDPLSETDWNGWKSITQKHGSDLQLTGDDLFVTNPEILRRGITRGAGNSVLVKLNQIGSLSETLDTIRIAQSENYGVTISHRSGETTDTTIADLAVATGAGQIKTGSLCRSERVAKYNRLMMIENSLGDSAQFAGPRGFPSVLKKFKD